MVITFVQDVVIAVECHWLENLNVLLKKKSIPGIPTYVTGSKRQTLFCFHALMHFRCCNISGDIIGSLDKSEFPEPLYVVGNG